ncbi:hypothetical protein CCR75_007864 [Bremia lactucae]|uniref:Kinesin motor domain-containing protein n=1 Tax=Bremia lactucae TaxID=4779 RepID=A0A976FKQ9_BRELC|nr:hypothetical protein CCR75_007864 [Bremia lactucae]
MDITDTNVKVFCRVRPPNERECGNLNLSSSNGPVNSKTRANVNASFAKKCVAVPVSDALQQTLFLHSKHGPSKTFTFDRVFDENSNQNDVFEVVGAPITRACLEGYNGTIFAYGQTGSGKTFSMQGPDDFIDTNAHCLTQEQLALRGLVPRVFDYLFDNVMANDTRKSVQHTFACSFLEIYNERVYDLLDRGSAKDAAGLQLRENGRKGVHVEGLIESIVTSSAKAAELMTIGAQNRRVGQTSMNRESSRSHSVFILQLQSKETTAEGTKTRTSRLNLVDLAGSERQRSTDAVGERLKEAGSINKSLSALGNVILGLSEQSVGKHRHVHYRDSKLTFLLKDSLGGNSKTFMIATISPAEDSAFETLSTLKFAQRAKLIQNSAIVNEIATGSVPILQEEIERLRRHLQQAHLQIARCHPQQGSLALESLINQDSIQEQVASCDPARGYSCRGLEEAFAASIEKYDSLQRSCEYLRLQYGHVLALCTELKQSNAHLRLMLRLGGLNAHDYKPSADAIEWRMKYEELEERVIELQDELCHTKSRGASITGYTANSVEALNKMLLDLTRQFAVVLHDKHELQDRLNNRQSKKVESIERPFSQDAIDAEFSGRLEKALKYQANEYEAKLDSLNSLNACLKEKAAEIALELHQVSQRDASWSIHQLNYEIRAADSDEALLVAKEAQLLTKERLFQEICKVKELEFQLKQVREGIRLEHEAVLADNVTVSEDLKKAKELLQQQLDQKNAELGLSEQQIQVAACEIAQLKVEIDLIKEANQKSVLLLDKSRDDVKGLTLLTSRLRAEITSRDEAIDELKSSEELFNEKKRSLEYKVILLSNSFKELQDEANGNAKKHLESVVSLKHQAQAQEQKILEVFKFRLNSKDKDLEQLLAELNRHQMKAEDTALHYILALEHKQAALEALQHQLDDERHKSNLALSAVQEKLSHAVSEASKLSNEKDQVNCEYASAFQQIESLQIIINTHEKEKAMLFSENQSISECLEELRDRSSGMENQCAELHKLCDRQQAQLSTSAESIKTFTEKIEELQQLIKKQSHEGNELRNDLATAKEDCRQAAIIQAAQLADLSSRAIKIKELMEELEANMNTIEGLTKKHNKAEGVIRDLQSAALRQQEGLKMYQGIQFTLRDELKSLEFERLELVENLKVEQESSLDVKEKFAEAKNTWLEESQRFQKEVLALQKRADTLSRLKMTLSSRMQELKLENENFKTVVAEKESHVQKLIDCVTDMEANIHALKASIGNSGIIQEQLNDTVAELRSCISNLNSQLTEQQKTISKQGKELTEKLTVITGQDEMIATLKQRLLQNETKLDQKCGDYKAELNASSGRVQDRVQLIAEKAAFAKVEEQMAEKDALNEKGEERETGAQQSEQLMQEIKQVEETDANLLHVTNLVVDSETTIARSVEDASSANVQGLQIALKDLQAKYLSAISEKAKLEEQKKQLKSYRDGAVTAQERSRSFKKTPVPQLTTATLKKAKTIAITQDVLVQAKRNFLAEKMKLQREIKALSKKLEMMSNEKEKLVGHQNSRQKIQHHARVKEENNRLLEQVRQLSDDKFKLQRSLERVRLMLTEKENIDVESSSNTPLLVSPASSDLCKTSTPQQVEQTNFERAPKATAIKAAKLTARDQPISRSVSPGPRRKRARTPAGPGWQK